MNGNISDKSQQVMRSSHKPYCYLCGEIGDLAYEGLRDRLFGAAGEWNLLRCGNAECGLMWLSPMPIPEDIAMAYAHYYTHAEVGNASPPSLYKRLTRKGSEHYISAQYGYPRTEGLISRFSSPLVYFDPGSRAHADFSVFYLHTRPGGRLLEIGCGSGDMLLAMKKRGWDVAGLDPDPKAVNRARSHGLDVIAGNLHTGRYEENSFDAVVMSHVIEHLHDPRVVLSECYRILRPGGQIVLITPNTKAWGHRVFGRHWLHLDPPRHLHLFNRRNLSSLVCQLGFELLRADTMLRDASVTLAASAIIKQCGSWRFGAPIPPATAYKYRLLELMEWIGILFDRDLGEEFVCIARKA